MTKKDAPTTEILDPAPVCFVYAMRMLKVLLFLINEMMSTLGRVTPPPKGCSIASPLLPIIATSLQISTSCQFLPHDMGGVLSQSHRPRASLVVMTLLWNTLCGITAADQMTSIDVTNLAHHEKPDHMSPMNQ